MKKYHIVFIFLFFSNLNAAQNSKESFYPWRDIRRALTKQRSNSLSGQTKVLKVNYSLLKGASDITETERLVILAKEFGLPQSVIDAMLWFYEINQNVQKIRATKFIICQNERWCAYFMEADKSFKYDYGKIFLSLTVEFK
ncbi:MAG: hypothetical protein PHT40_01040 [Patescibacteria group bacterium]|nr:hypothetical protein [Patescibacteria group bacterium]